MHVFFKKIIIINIARGNFSLFNAFSSVTVIPNLVIQKFRHNTLLKFTHILVAKHKTEHLV